MEINARLRSEVNRAQLSHILRAANRVADDPDIIVIGSQAILGSFSDEDLPLEATRSMEADLAFHNDTDERKSDLVDGSIGELSSFHETFGYYGQGVSLATAVVPAGWADRVVPYMYADSAPSRATCLDPHDLVVSKLVAGRLKDIEFVKALLEDDLLSAKLLIERAEMLEVPRAVITRIETVIRRLATFID